MSAPRFADRRQKPHLSVKVHYQPILGLIQTPKTPFHQSNLKSSPTYWQGQTKLGKYSFRSLVLYHCSHRPRHATLCEPRSQRSNKFAARMSSNIVRRIRWFIHVYTLRGQRGRTIIYLRSIQESQYEWAKLPIKTIRGWMAIARLRGAS